MNHFIVDASALAKHYVSERGRAVMNRLVNTVDGERVHCLTIGVLETHSIIIRARNGGRIAPDIANDALIRLYADATTGGWQIIDMRMSMVLNSGEFITRHHVNSTDAVLLRAALDLQAAAQANGDTVVLVASDRRLLRAAQAEGLATFDPESEDENALQALIAS